MGFLRGRRIKRPVEGHAVIVEAWQKPTVGSQSGAGSGNCKMASGIKRVLGVPE